MDIRIINDEAIVELINENEGRFAKLMMRSLLDGDDIEFDITTKGFKLLVENVPNVAGIPFVDLLNKMPYEDMDDELFTKCLYTIATRLARSKFRNYEISESIMDKARKAAEKSATGFKLGYSYSNDVFFNIRFGWLNYSEAQVDELIELCPPLALRIDKIYIDKIERVYELMKDDERLEEELLESRLFTKIIDGDLNLYKNIKNDGIKKLLIKAFIYMYGKQDFFSVRLYNSDIVFNYMNENDKKFFKQCEVEFSLDPEEIRRLGQYILPF